ncbi:RDD family protein [Alphaproteobacteria bacterium KMM 3653]|uniref:RDD family protein n=1 Tax=Harenicola maris TaxID=2841044 RepID=A0AAP2G3R8_9RHOB|nr:RDD family protein [Harenicola maris]
MTYSDPSGLPDPEIHADFYDSTTSKRFFAWVIDCLAIFFLTLLIIPFTLFLGLLIFPFLWLMVGLVYRIVTLANWSATPGMRIMAIEFRTLRGTHFALGEAAMHTGIYTLSLGSIVVQVISVVLMLTNPRGQGLSDMIVGSAVINRAASF